MSAMSKNQAREDSAQAQTGDDAITKIVDHIAKTAINANAELSSQAELQIELREAGARQDLLHDLVDSICPEKVNPKIWQDWLAGGKSPFGNGKLAKTGTAAEKPNLTMSRGTTRVRAQEKKIDRLKAELAAEESRLDYFEAIEKAALHWHVTDQLLSIIAPVFAMGPAWTVMRALSAHPPEELVDEMTAFFDDEDKEVDAKKFRGEYAEETAKILVGLDLHSGIEEFEQRLRKAIKQVVEEFDDRKDLLAKDGRRKRSAERMKTSANPEGLEDADDFLRGFE